jgi:winged helix-turn-helix DNA-binding protein
VDKPPVLEKHAQLRLLDALEAEPEISQADLAVRVGVAVGTVNWYLKRWAADGYLHIKRIGRWRWRYILTPHGMAEKARLGAAFIERSMRLYRETREQARARLTEVRSAGYDRVQVAGDGDLADVCRLTCLERGVAVTQDADAPALCVDGTDIRLQWPKDGSRDAGSDARD